MKINKTLATAMLIGALPFAAAVAHGQSRAPMVDGNVISTTQRVDSETLAVINEQNVEAFRELRRNQTYTGVLLDGNGVTIRADTKSLVGNVATLIPNLLNVKDKEGKYLSEKNHRATRLTVRLDNVGSRNYDNGGEHVVTVYLPGEFKDVAKNFKLGGKVFVINEGGQIRVTSYNHEETFEVDGVQENRMQSNRVKAVRNSVSVEKEKLRGEMELQLEEERLKAEYAKKLAELRKNNVSSPDIE